jgi:hypothetical protein
MGGSLSPLGLGSKYYSVPTLSLSLSTDRHGGVVFASERTEGTAPACVPFMEASTQASF